MEDSRDTCWTMIQDAAGGAEPRREEFAQTYLPLVRAYLGARWGRGPLEREAGDAVQEVFVECLREGGVLERADPKRPGGFRAFLYGVVRNVARRHEERYQRQPGSPTTTFDPDDQEDGGETPSRLFDRLWAESVMRDAAQEMERRAAVSDEAARRRVELLQLRFREDLPIREIAQRWDEDSAWVHHQYARARDEFRRALESVLEFHDPASPGAARKEAERLIELFG